MRTTEIRAYIQRKKGELHILSTQQAKLLETRENLIIEQSIIEEAQMILQYTAKQTQNRLSFHISNFISSALQSIWGEDAYTFTLEFIEKRNKTEVKCYCIQRKEQYHLKI